MRDIESPLPAAADGGQAPDLPPGFAPELPREVRYLRYTILQALSDAGIGLRFPCSPDRCGIILGTTLHGMRAGGRFLRSGNFQHLQHFLAGSVLRDATADLSFGGCAVTTCSACSSSLSAIALGLSVLRAGQLDLVVAGGYDTISEYAYGGFSTLRLVAAGPLRPFARDRQGMKLAEGYGIVVLERSGAAAARGARAIASVLGYGESSDAHHLTRPHPEGEGAARAIHAALADAGLEPPQIDLIAAHATGTPDNDAAEFLGMSRAFGAGLSRVPVVAFKSHIGHTLGGAGAVELVLSAMALRDQVIPGCANMRTEEVEFAGLQLAIGPARPACIRATLNTSLGFGGANACMILGEADVAGCDELARTVGPSLPPRPRRITSEAEPAGPTSKDFSAGEVLITGIGVAFPGAVGNEAFHERLLDTAHGQPSGGGIADAEIVDLLNARRVRRMSEYVKASLAAAVLCLRDSGVGDVSAFAENCAAILGTTHGSTGYCESYYRQIVTEGIAAANPILFAEGVPNSASAHLSLMLSLKGPCQTIIGSRTAGLDALRLAAARIRTGEWQRAIVGAAEEYSTVIQAAYRDADITPSIGAGAVMFLLENPASLKSRGGRAVGRVIEGSGAAARPKRMPRLLRSVLDQLDWPAVLVGSANGTWLDRVEASARAPIGGSVYGTIAECFSVIPLAGIASVLLTGAIPRPHPAAPREHRGRERTNDIRRFGAIATDYAGFVSGVAIERLSAER